MSKGHEESPEEHKKKHQKDVQDLWEEIELREEQIKEHEKRRRLEEGEEEEDKSSEEE